MRVAQLRLPEMEVTSHLLVIDWMRPRSANTVYGLHHMAKAAYVAEWRAAGSAAAMLAKLDRWDALEATVQARYSKGRLTDPDAMAPTWKAVCDGLVDRRVIPDDDGTRMRGVTFLPPFLDRGQPDALLVLLTEVPFTQETPCLLPPKNSSTS